MGGANIAIWLKRGGERLLGCLYGTVRSYCSVSSSVVITFKMVSRAILLTSEDPLDNSVNLSASVRPNVSHVFFLSKRERNIFQTLMSTE